VYSYEEVPRSEVSLAVLRAVERAREFRRHDLGVNPQVRFFRKFGGLDPRKYFGETFTHELDLRGCYNTQTRTIWVNAELSPAQAASTYSHEVRHAYQERVGCAGIDREGDARRYQRQAREAITWFEAMPEAFRWTDKRLLRTPKYPEARPQTRTLSVEKRTVTAQTAQTRAFTEGSQRKIRGYAVVWDAISQPLGGGFTESFQKGAFSKYLRSGQPIKALWNHNSDMPLGSTRNGTLLVWEDEYGLRYEIILPDTSWAADAWEAVSSGLVDGTSFGFFVIRDHWGKRDGRPHRTVTEAKLLEVSPTPFPAYEATTAEAASATKRSLPFSMGQLRAALYRRHFNIPSGREGDHEIIRRAINVLERIAG